MRKTRFRSVSARRRPLPGVLSTHRDPVPHHRAQQDLRTGPLALDGPRGLRSRRLIADLESARLSDTRLAVLPASSTTATACT